MNSRHSRIRQQQRGLPPLVVHWLDDFGREVHALAAPSSATSPSDARRRLERYVGREPVRRMHEYLDAYAVYGTDGTLITAGHRYDADSSQGVHHEFRSSLNAFTSLSCTGGR